MSVSAAHDASHGDVDHGPCDVDKSGLTHQLKAIIGVLREEMLHPELAFRTGDLFCLRHTHVSLQGAGGGLMPRRSITPLDELAFVLPLHDRASGRLHE